MAEIEIPVSFGELLDKISILQIKQERIADAGKLRNIEDELSALEGRWRAAAVDHGSVGSACLALREVNVRLWEIEDRIRLKEGAASFDAEFIALARAVYFENDERARLKRVINDALGSRLVEEKSYASYQRPGERPAV